MSEILLLGAHGAIGSVLKRNLLELGHSLTLVSRRGEGNTLVFTEALADTTKCYDLVIDASNGTLNDYLILRDWLNATPVRAFVHFSSVRVGYCDEKDSYANYKRSVLFLLQEVERPCYLIEGDLFADDHVLVGYWNFVRDYTRWRFFSHRDLYVADLKWVAATLEQLARGSPGAIQKELHELPVLDVNMIPICNANLSAAKVKLLFQLRVNTFLRPLKSCLVL